MVDYRNILVEKLEYDNFMLFIVWFFIIKVKILKITIMIYIKKKFLNSKI